MGHDLAPQPQRVELVLGEVVADAAHRRVHPRAAELFVLGVFARGHLHQRRTGEIHLGLVLHHHHVVAHPRQVRAARGAAPEHQAHGRDPVLRALRQAAEAGAAAHEDLVLVGEVGAGALDQADADEVVLLRDLRQPARLLQAHRRHGAALHGRFARDHQALDAAHETDPADDRRPGRLALHTVAGEGSDLEEVRVAIEEPLDALARQELPARAVTLDVLLATAGLRLTERRLELRERGGRFLAVGHERLTARVDLRANHRIPLRVAHRLHPSAARRRPSTQN